MIAVLRGLTFIGYWAAFSALIWGVIVGSERLASWFHNRSIKKPTAGANQTVGLNNDSEV